MPLPLVFLLIAAILPLAGFVLLILIGDRLGEPLAGWIGSALAIAGFGCTLTAMVYWYYGMHGVENWGFAVRPILRTFAWLPGVDSSRATALEAGAYIDSLTIAMFAMVTAISAIVHIFSVRFFRRDEKSSRFFAALSFAAFAMLGAVLSATLVQVLVFWGLIGISSYLVVGYHSGISRQSRGAAGAFIINRIGDCGLLIGCGLLFSRTGSLSMPALWAALGDVAAGHAVRLSDGSWMSVAFATFAGLCLVGGAAVRCAQFPFQLWLGMAAEGPVPGLAMVAAATTSASGVYLVGRLFPILTPDARLCVAIIGITTLTMASLITLVQRELPRLLAWAAVCQFGYMMLAFGIGSWVGALFQLITNAFVMTAVILSAGSVIAANEGERNMQRLRGGWRILPVTAAVFAIAIFATAGTPFLSKYYSQSMILTDAGAFATFATAVGGRSHAYWVFFILPVLAGYLIAFGMTRCWMLTFDNKTAGDSSEKPLREQAGLWMPMLAAAIPAIVAGYAMNVPELLQRSMIETSAFCEDLRLRGAFPGQNHFSPFDQVWPSAMASVAASDSAEAVDAASAPSSRAADALEHGRALVRIWVLWTWLIGVGAAVAVYWRGAGFMARLVRRPPLCWVYEWLNNEMYFPELYDWTLLNLVLGLVKTCDFVDRYVLDNLWRFLAKPF